ncbi:hypothetical protein AB1N83_008723 [Pleurotus pulmonarius]
MNKKQQLVPLTDLNVTQEPHVTLHHNGRTDTPTSTSTINITLHVTHTSDGDIFNGHISNGFAGGHYNQNSYNPPPPSASPLRSTETPPSTKYTSNRLRSPRIIHAVPSIHD